LGGGLKLAMQHGEMKRDHFKTVIRDAIKQLEKGKEAIVFSEEQYNEISNRIECKMCYNKDGFISLTPIGGVKPTKLKKRIEVTNKHTNETQIFKAESKASMYMGRCKGFIGWRRERNKPQEDDNFKWKEIYIKGE